MHEATPGECTLCDRSCRYFIQNDFFCRLAGPVAPTGKAIVHWIGCINAIKNIFYENIVSAIVLELQWIYSTVEF